jgi:D-serine deaminase-like pyridoxal phosphate-dependent protein
MGGKGSEAIFSDATERSGQMDTGAKLKFEKRSYEVGRLERILTPALLIYADYVRQNIQTTLNLVGGDARRLRPHIKTAKLSWAVRELVSAGVSDFKCATTLELLTAATCGARDVLMAFPATGANAERVRQIAASFPSIAISALVESAERVGEWAGSGVGLFIDVNPGMDRTGIEQERSEAIVDLAKAIRKAKIAFRGVHYYDGHLHSLALDERTRAAHRGYDRLMEIAAALKAAGVPAESVVTSGTPAFPCALAYAGFRSAPFHHQFSPGTVFYNDLRSLSQLPHDWAYRPAAVVLSRVVSRPRTNFVTCDAGHKTISADAGVPNCRAIGREDLTPGEPSEEHLRFEVPEGSSVPAIGDFLCLVPKHVCPTVNNFDHALIVEQGKIARLERVSARGRENPLTLSLRGPEAIG